MSLQTKGEVRLAAASPAALIVIGSLTLVGGGLSGQGHVVVQGPTVLLANGSNNSEPSSLKNGVTLKMHGGGAWSGGHLQARDGATVVNEGLFEVFAGDGATFGAGEGRRPTIRSCFQLLIVVANCLFLVAIACFLLRSGHIYAWPALKKFWAYHTLAHIRPVVKIMFNDMDTKRLLRKQCSTV